MKPILFRDQVKLYVTAGDGGDGGVYFRREKFVPFGGPSGGDGGDGGSVILRGDVQTDSLLDLYDHPHQKAEIGEHGGTNQCTGRRGQDLVVKVPRGTVVRLDRKDGPIIGEVLEDGQELNVAQGGKGGLGNIHFKTSSHQAPKEFTPGTEGEKKILWLELKLIADVGLVGYPNAGKSTLLTQLTQAHPKIANYPFTTCNPIMGTLEFEDYRRARIADIPGLIDGAHEGIGLGHEFLRHIERTRLLLFVLDMGGTEGRDPLEDFESLRDELRLYNPELGKRPFRIVANKMDEPAADGNLARFLEETGLEALPVIAELGEGVDAVKRMLHETLFGDEPPPDLITPG
ncbi:MAG: GTPase ObgE [Verrucomicrobia bacterium]|nr:GTPase ObgE [Verrucomicrobiota bacterium]MCH8526114.1 GTPase ObgE [Kiritimatiellia bacterium]